jgi:DNA-directed RNA polymerase specialized sigma24 family protein
MREAYKITNDFARSIPYLSRERREELASFLVEKALVAVTRFDPERETTTYGQNGGRHFDSWICDVMQWRCVDWLRAKSEGNGDSRYGSGNRIVLTGDEFDDTDPEVEIERFLSDDRVSEWKAAADLVGLPLAEFVVITLDRAAAAIQTTVKGPAAL